MPIFHFSAKIVSRNRKRKAVEKAAYNSRSSLIDENTGRRHSYNGRGVCLFSKIMLPNNAPEWLHKLSESRQKLWSTVEAVEKRKDAQLAREIVIALPHELTDEEREVLTENYVRDTFCADGMVADVAIHPSPERGDRRNYHAHILLTMRAIEDNGFGMKNRRWNDKTKFQQWRVMCERTTNRHLEMAGYTNIKVSCQSLKAQGIHREPLIHIGPAANYFERWGMKTARGNKLRDIRNRNILREELQRYENDIDEVSEKKRARENHEHRFHNDERTQVIFQHIGNIMLNRRRVSRADLQDLPLTALNLMKDRNVEVLQRLMKRSERHREMGGRER